MTGTLLKIFLYYWLIGEFFNLIELGLEVYRYKMWKN